MTITEPQRLPPGDTGWPLLGETIPFLKDGYGFVDKRVAKHGPIFRTSVLGRNTAVIAGPDASALWIDGDKVIREGAMPSHIQDLFGGRSLPLLDGAAHFSRKTQVLAGFTRDALSSYLPPLEELVEQTLTRWATAGEVTNTTEALKRLALEGICRNVMNLPAGAETEALRADYHILGGGFSALPLALPGTALARALKAQSRIFAIFDQLIKQHQEKPQNDGLSRILAFKDNEGQQITAEAARLELHHVVIAGLIIFAEFAATLRELHLHADVRKRLTDEVRAKGAGPLTLEKLAAMEYLGRVVMEVKRSCPIVPVSFGKARRTFEFKGYTVPEGWMVLWALRATHQDASVYPQPEKFDPERFAAPRDEHQKHEHAFSPQGPGPATGHKCPGTDYATYFMQVFATVLLRGYEWELPEQDLALDWALIPPEVKSKLHLKLRRL